MIDLSIIIPIYNAEYFLEILLKKILNNQKNIELILINDGSTDNSKKICLKYLNKDKRVKFINQINKGPGAARNKGIDVCSGEYITFLDADDSFKDGWLDEILYHIRESNNDLYCMGYINEVDGRTILPNDIVLNKEEISGNLIEIIKLPYFNPLWNKFYKATIIKNNNIKMPEKYNLGEDFIFNIRTLEYIENIKFIDKAYLNYNNNENSITKSYHNDKFENYIYINEEFKKLVVKFNADYEIIYTKYIKDIFSSFINLYHKDCKKSIHERREYVNKILDKDIVKESIKKTKTKTIKYKILHSILKMGNINCILIVSRILYTFKSFNN